MLHIEVGQCGLCTHFGEESTQVQPVLTQIRTSKEAKEDFIDRCGHPKHADLHLKVTAVSGCDGFTPAIH
jgi:hypothetical protein